MVGGTTKHNLITLNIARLLHGSARKRGCRIFANDVKLRAGSDRVYYPDILLACGAAASVDMIVDEPSLVVEVSSRSTRATDRREKLDTYMKLPSLRSYLIIEQRRRHVLAYTRDRQGEWERAELTSSGNIRLDFLDTALTLDEIYDDVPMPPLQVGEAEDDDWYEVDDEDDAD
jgi:Uma2 family endonuclease